MSGYTPLFNSLTRGSLCGRWPDIGLWAVILSLSDRHGVVDMHPNAIAALTGLPADEVVACMERFCQPDPESRSKDADGRRLVLIDEGRTWGWRIVNHGRYRDKARKAAYDAARTESGRDAERKREERASRRVPTCPDSSRPTNTNTDANIKPPSPDGEGGAGGGRKRPSPAPTPPPEGLDMQAWERWEQYRREIRKPIKPASMLAAQRKLAGFGADQAAIVEQSIANGWQGLFPLKDDSGGGEIDAYFRNLRRAVSRAHD